MDRSLRLPAALAVLLSTAGPGLAQGLVGCQLVLAGNAAVGALLKATAVADAQAALPSPTYHWYRLRPGQSSWLLIAGAQGTTYVPAPVDIGQNLMVVAVVNQRGVV